MKNMSNAPLTPPANDDEIQHPSTAEQTAVPAAPPNASGPPRQQAPTVYRQLFPTLANLSVQGKLADVVRLAEEGDLNADSDWDETRLLIITPLVLAYLILDDLPPARHALGRLPELLSHHPLCRALLNIVAATWDRKYAKVYRYTEELEAVVQQPDFFEISLAAIVKGLVQIFLDTFRQRTLVLLSKAYSSITLSLAEFYLGLPPDLVLAAAQRNDWSYNPSTHLLTPGPAAKYLGRTTPYEVSSGSSLFTFNLIADGNARLESVT